MTRSEEELHVGTQTRERGRARLRKYVTTEQQQVTVPVQREEEVVVDKRAVPKERVRLDTETVTEERQVPRSSARSRSRSKATRTSSGAARTSAASIKSPGGQGPLVLRRPRSSLERMKEQRHGS
jgi:uncharacterized protein (TIGR02271 family)